MKNLLFSRGEILFRAALYCLIAALPTSIDALKAGHINWPLTLLMMLYQCAVALRAFYDKSSANSHESAESEAAPTAYAPLATAN